MTIGLVDRQHFGGRMIGPLLAEVGILAGADAGRKPDPAFLVHHRIVIESVAIPDGFGAPVSGRTKGVVLCRWRIRVADGMQDFTGRVRFRIQDRYPVRTVLSRSIDLTVGIYSRIAAVCGDLVMEIRRRPAPVP